MGCWFSVTPMGARSHLSLDSGSYCPSRSSRQGISPALLRGQGSQEVGALRNRASHSPHRLQEPVMPPDLATPILAVKREILVALETGRDQSD